MAIRLYETDRNAAFPLGLTLAREDVCFYRIAEPGKALCDKLYTMPPVENTNELFTPPTEDFCIKKSELRRQNTDKIKMLSDKYHSTNVKNLRL